VEKKLVVMLGELLRKPRATPDLDPVGLGVVVIEDDRPGE
jgi:hypothetical protein